MLCIQMHIQKEDNSCPFPKTLDDIWALRFIYILFISFSYYLSVTNMTRNIYIWIIYMEYINGKYFFVTRPQHTFSYGYIHKFKHTERWTKQAYIVVVIYFKGLDLLILILFMSFIEYNGEPDYINSNKRLLSVVIWCDIDRKCDSINWLYSRCIIWLLW